MNTELAWVAGLFDGEGTFYIARQKSRNANFEYSYTLRMKLGMCHAEAVYKLQSILGGSVHVEHQPAKNSNFKQYRWAVSGKEAIEAAKRLRPYLIVKADEADIFLEWESGVAAGRHQKMTEELYVQRTDLYARLRAAKISDKYTAV